MAQRTTISVPLLVGCVIRSIRACNEVNIRRIGVEYSIFGGSDYTTVLVQDISVRLGLTVVGDERTLHNRTVQRTELFCGRR